MNFYTVNGSPNTRKVHAVINYLGLDVNICELDIFAGELATPEYMDMNPNGMVPLLEDGDFRLSESNAIMQYLASMAGNTDFYPEDARSRADIQRWLSWEQSHFNRATGTFVYEYMLKNLFKLGEPDQDRLNEATENFNRFAKVLDDHLENRKFLLGDSLTLADFAVASMSAYLDVAKVPYQSYKNICAWLNRLDEIPAWVSTPKLAA